MATVHWKYKNILHYLKRRVSCKTAAATIIAFVCLLYLNRVFVEFYCSVVKEALDVPTVCFTYDGRTANLMFQYAFHYSFARSRNLQMVKLGNFSLNEAFTLYDWNPYPNQTFCRKCCRYIQTKQDIYDCGYDKRVEKLHAGESVHMWGYFQSWRYWKDYESEVRKMYSFKPSILSAARSEFGQILQQWNVDLKKDMVTLIGVHIRRGDYIKVKRFQDYGYKTAPAEYLYRAMDYMRKHHGRCLFIICTNDPVWSKQTLEKFSDVHFVTGNSAFVDMALLSLTSHTIMTVGTFGWWVGFLTNGTTIYYKYPFFPGTSFAKQFREGKTEDHFYPGWIAME